MVAFFVSVWIKFFFLFTPFFALSMFLSMTSGDEIVGRRRRLALQASFAVAVVCLVLLFLGNQIFAVFGITLDAFRIGAGALLFLSAISLVQGRAAPADEMADSDIAVVPLAIPIIVGPATTGTLLVLGAELQGAAEKTFGCLALLLAVACLGAILLLGTVIQRWLGSRGLRMLSKLTGLILSALAAQMIMTGVGNFLNSPG